MKLSSPVAAATDLFAAHTSGPGPETSVISTWCLGKHLFSSPYQLIVGMAYINLVQGTDFSGGRPI